MCCIRSVVRAVLMSSAVVARLLTVLLMTSRTRASGKKKKRSCTYHPHDTRSSKQACPQNRNTEPDDTQLNEVLGQEKQRLQAERVQR